MKATALRLRVPAGSGTGATNPAFNTAGKLDLPDQPRQRLRDVGPRRPARHHLAQHGRARQLAEEMEFEALVPVARWHGFGGATNPVAPASRSYLPPASPPRPSASGVFGDLAHPLLNHPIAAAKQLAVIDYTSGGRYALNIVTGWKCRKSTCSAARCWDTRIAACAEEWITIIKRPWTEDDASPRRTIPPRSAARATRSQPIQAPYPAIMNAGASERGRHFAAKYADMALYGDPHRQPRRMPRARAGLPQARARITAARSRSGCRQHRAGRDRERGATSTATTCTRK